MESLKSAYLNYLEIIKGNVESLNNKLVQYGNCGIPIGFGDLRTRW